MNIDNQLLLGVVFIIAGVAMALLAYAVILNRRSNDGAEVKGAWEAIEPGQDEAIAVPPEGIGPTPPTPPPGFEEPTRLVRAPEPVPEMRVPAPPPSAAPPPAQPEPVAPPGSVSLARDPASGKLIIKHGDHKFTSMRELKNSPVWEQVGTLFEELHAWMVIVPPGGASPAKGPEVPSEPTKKAPPASSMIGQINEILEEKLAQSASAPRGVHLGEAADGSIRVFIGVEGFPMDDVPNPEVRQLIREAVAEWESRA